MSPAKRFLNHDVCVTFHDFDLGARGPVTVTCSRCEHHVRRDAGRPDALYAALEALDEQPCAVVTAQMLAALA